MVYHISNENKRINIHNIDKPYNVDLKNADRKAQMYNNGFIYRKFKKDKTDLWVRSQDNEVLIKICGIKSNLCTGRQGT